MKNKLPWLILIVLLFVAAVSTVTYRGYFIGNAGGLTNTVPRQYDLHRDFGAACDRLEFLGSCTSNSTTINSLIPVFSASDVGKWILVINGGVTNPAARAHFDHSTTIASFVNSTTITLSSAMSNTLAATQMIYGTPANTQLQAALNTAASNQCDTVILIPASCVFDPTLIDPGAATNHHNSQLVLPPVKTYLGYPTITIRGTSKPSGNYQRNGILGTVLTSMIEAPATYQQNDTPRFFDVTDFTTTLVPSIQTPPWFAGPQLCRVVIENLAIELPHDNGQIGLDLYSALQANVRNVVVMSSHASGGGVLNEPMGNSVTNQVGIVFPFEASYGEHTLENSAFYSLGSAWSAVGVFKSSGNMAYGCANGVTARDHPGAYRSFSDTFMECSNVFYLPHNATMTMSAFGLCKINTSAFAEWADPNNFLVNSPDGGMTANIDYFDFGASGLNQGAVPRILNSSVVGRVHWHTMGADVPDNVGGNIKFLGKIAVSNDLSTASILYGEPANIERTFPIFAENSLGSSSASILTPMAFVIGGSQLYGYGTTSNVWCRFHYPGIQFNQVQYPGWTNRKYINFTFQLIMTNNGVTPFQIAYDVFGVSTKISGRGSPTLYATNTSGGPSIITVTWGENFPVVSTWTNVQPQILWWGAAGGGNPFSATNNALLLPPLKINFSNTSDQSQ